MSEFVNGSAIAIERWSGFKPCSHQSDCFLSERENFSILVACQLLTQGPISSQKYCVCDLSLGGDLCSIVTQAAVKQIACFAMVVLISLWPLLLGMWEIKERNKVKHNITGVYVSLWIAATSLLLEFAFGVIGVYMIVAGPGTVGIAYIRLFHVSILIPLCVAFSFCSTMIISVELLKIAHDPGFGGNWNKGIHRRIQSFVVGICVTLVVGFFSLSYLVNFEVAATFTFCWITVGAVFSLRSGNQFNIIARGFVGAHTTLAAKRMARTFKQVVAANRQTSLGLCGTVLSILMMTVVQNIAGLPINEDGFRVSSGVLMIVGVFVGITSHASINFGRQARLVRQQTMKTKIVPGATKKTRLFDTSIQSSRIAPG